MGAVLSTTKVETAGAMLRFPLCTPVTVTVCWPSVRFGFSGEVHACSADASTLHRKVVPAVVLENLNVGVVVNAAGFSSNVTGTISTKIAFGLRVKSWSDASIAQRVPWTKMPQPASQPLNCHPGKGEASSLIAPTSPGGIVRVCVPHVVTAALGTLALGDTHAAIGVVLTLSNFSPSIRPAPWMPALTVSVPARAVEANAPKTAASTAATTTPRRLRAAAE